MSIEDFKTEQRLPGYAISEYIGYDPIVKIPSNINGHEIKVIGDYAFSVNKSVMHIIVPQGIKFIQPYAFAACANLETIKLPNTIVEIFPNAFYRCDSLKTIIFDGSKKEWDKINITTLNLEDVKIKFTKSKSEISDFINDISEDMGKELKDK